MVRWELPGLEMPWYTPQTESSDSHLQGQGSWLSWWWITPDHETTLVVACVKLGSGPRPARCVLPRGETR